MSLSCFSMLSFIVRCVCLGARGVDVGAVFENTVRVEVELSSNAQD